MSITQNLRLACVALIGVTGQAQAEASMAGQVQTDLAAANLPGAAALATTALAADPNDATARFALGAIQFLGAVEHLGQGLYDHGLTPNDYSIYGIPTVTSLPFLRLPVGHNPNPAPFTADAFRQMLIHFDRDLMTAEATLAQVPAGPVSLPLDVRRIGLDFNHDGQMQINESLPALISTISGVGMAIDFPTVGFDESDVIWLRGYSHLLAGITDVLLAHDWTQTVNLTFQSAFPQAGLPSALLDSQRPLLEQTLRANLSPHGECFDINERFTQGPMTRTEIEARARMERCYAAQNALTYGGIWRSGGVHSPV